MVDSFVVETITISHTNQSTLQYTLPAKQNKKYCVRSILSYGLGLGLGVKAKLIGLFENELEAI